MAAGARALEEILCEGHLQGATQPLRQRDAVVLGSLLMCGRELYRSVTGNLRFFGGSNLAHCGFEISHLHIAEIASRASVAGGAKRY